MTGISLYSQGTGCNAACADLAPRPPLTPLPVGAVLPAGEGPPLHASSPAPPLTRSADLTPLVALLNSLPASSLPPTDAVTTRAHYAGLMAHLVPWIVGTPAQPMMMQPKARLPLLGS